MSKRFAMLSVLTTCLATTAWFSALRARDDAPANWKSLETRYAEANLELAQARLAVAKSQNAQAGGSVSASTVAALEAGVQLTQQRLQQLKAGGNADPYMPWIAAAEQAVKGLEANHNESLEANKLQAGAVSDAELRRESAELDVAKARLASVKAVAQQPADLRIRWVIGQLQDEIRALWARPLMED